MAFISCADYTQSASARNAVMSDETQLVETRRQLGKFVGH
jgi:hypothetical protein